MDERLTDPLDFAADLSQKLADDEIGRIRRAAAEIPVGSQGDCDFCGYWSGRLVDGACAPCRDHNARMDALK